MADGLNQYATAKGYCQSACLMMSSPHRYKLPDDVSLILSFHNLIGFAVELYLKSFLIRHEMVEDDLRKHPFGHDLSNLIDEAKKRGFKCEAGNNLVEYLPMHKTLGFRYMKDGSTYNVARIDEIFWHLNTLNRYVDEVVGASAGHGKEPGTGWEFPPDMSSWRLG